MFPSAINQQMAAVDDSALFLQNTQLLAQLQGNPSLSFSGVKAPAAPTMMRAIPQPMMGMDPGAQKSVMLPQQNGLNGGVGQNARPAMLHDRGNTQAALMHALAQQQAQINGANAYLQNNNAAVAAAATAAVAAAQQAAQVRAAQAQARATVANMLQQQQQLATRQQQQQRLNQQQAVLGQNMAFNQAVNAAIQRAAANGQNLNMPNAQQQQQQQLQQQQQQITMEAATQIVQQYQAQQAEQARRAQLLRQAHSLAQNQQAAAAAGNSAVALQALVKQAQLQEALARQQQQQQRPMQHQQQRPQQMGGYPFSHAQHLQAQQQQVAAQAHQQQQQQVQQAQLQAHVQQAQLQAQAQARHNMATLANLTPAQLQAISTNPTLAQAVIQARAQAQLAQAQARVNPSNPVPINHQAEAHNAQLNDQRLRQQQQQATAMAAAAAQGGAQGILGPPDLTSPVSSNAGSPPGGTNGGSNMGQHMNKEQRRMALACVALQLARSGLSMDQAIHSGIMGGMSVTDVRFIVDVYNAEMTRMKEGGAEGGGHGEKHAMNPAKLNVHTAHSSRLNSPDSPARSSCAGSESGHGVFSGGSVHAGQSSRTGSALGGASDLVQDLSNFDAFSYGFFGAGGQEELEGGLGDVLLGELEELGGAMEEFPLPLDDTAGLDVQQLSSWNGPGKDLVDGRLRGADAVKAVKKEDDVAERLANLDLGYGFF